MRSTSNNLREFEPASDIPECLRQHLTITEQPHEIYTFVSQNHEKRLRLLTRRFFNQIQYGCRNPNCDAPTCLSCRKRTSAGVLRPHNDVTARALATKCVEQYASRGRDLDRRSRRDKCKRTSETSVDGLCLNEPVVPWYADAKEYLAKKDAAASRSKRSLANSKPRSTSTSPAVQNYANEVVAARGEQVNVVLTNGTTKKPYHESGGHEGQLRNITQTDPQQPAAGKLIIDSARAAAQYDLSAEYESCQKGRHRVQSEQIDTSLRKATHNTVAALANEAASIDSIRSVVIQELNLEDSFFRDSRWESRSKDIIEAELNRFDDVTSQLPYTSGDDNSEVLRSDQQHPIEPSSSLTCNDQLDTDKHPSNPGSNGAVVPPASSEAGGGAQSDRFDRASFTQVLFSRPRIADTIGMKDTATCSRTNREDIIRKNATISTHHEPKAAEINAVTISRAFTFELLPSSAVYWLKSHFAEPHCGHVYMDELDVPHFAMFVEQSLFYVFTQPYRLIRSAATWHHYPGPVAEPPVVEDLILLDSTYYAEGGSLRVPSQYATQSVCNDIYGWGSDRKARQGRVLGHLYQLLSSLYCGSERAYGLPVQKHKPSMNNRELAYLITLIINIAWTTTVIGGINRADDIEEYYQTVDEEKDFRNEVADTALIGLAVSIANVVSHCLAVHSAQVIARSEMNKTNIRQSRNIVESLVDFLRDPPCYPANRFAGTRRTIIRFMAAVILTRWDRTPILKRSSPVGGALEVLKALYQSRADLKLGSVLFEMEFIPAALDEVEMPFEWLSFKTNASTFHILQFSFLIPAVNLVKYFRSLNLKIMKQSHEKAMGTCTNGKSQLLLGFWRVNNVHEVFDKMRAHMARYFVMTIRREHILEDAVGQIWRRERQELTRPLKVRMGEDEGELGLDHGGVQQEFFRLVFAEAFDPRYGMFDTDQVNRMTWFKPGSLEPLYKYEALGILMSLAVFNGITLPITMPLAFYRKVLGLKVKKLEHIQDGWPELARSLKQMLEWTDGDVGDVMCRTYEFSYDVFGQLVSVDMSKKQSAEHGLSPKLNDNDRDMSSKDAAPPDPPMQQDAPLVTNANREAYVKDYIVHLTDTTIAPQLRAFLKGLHTLLSPQALAIFPPATLKLLIEGQPTSHPINLDDWREATTYEDYNASDPIITWFWEVLKEDLSQTQLRNLLEFVTASDRIPVAGWSGITFIVQRNAAGDEWLPGSSTCYGRLFLPEYSSKRILKEKLEKAIETSLGFGMV